MHAFAFSAVLLTLAVAPPAPDSDAESYPRDALCGAWEASLAHFQFAGQSLAAGQPELARRQLSQVIASGPAPFRQLALQCRSELDAALRIVPPSEALPASAPPASAAANTQPSSTVEAPSVELMDLADLPVAQHVRPEARLIVPELTIELPGATPDCGLKLEALDPPSSNVRPYSILKASRIYAFAQICEQMRAYRPAADLYWTGIEREEFSADRVAAELADCLARSLAPEAEFDALARQLKRDSCYDRLLASAMRQRDALLDARLTEGNWSLAWEVPAARQRAAGFDRLDFLLWCRPQIKSDEERLSFYNALSQALRQVGDDQGSDAWERKLLAEFAGHDKECLAVRVRRVRRLLAARQTAAAECELRRAAIYVPDSETADRVEAQLSSLAANRRAGQSVSAELLQAVLLSVHGRPGPASDDPFAVR